MAYMCCLLNIFGFMLQDRYSLDESEPKIDRSQDWQMLRGLEENGVTIIQFKRPLDTCDDKDVIIEVNILYFV